MRRVVVYAGSRNVYSVMAAAAKSLLACTRVDRVYFLTEDDTFPEPLPDVIRVMNMQGNPYAEQLVESPNAEALTYFTLLRLALPEILPEDRALWLDVDTIVEKDIGPLLDMDLGGNLAAMVEEPIRSQYPFRYHNAGVLLLDLAALRMDGRVPRMIARAKRQAFAAADQDVLNLYLQADTLTLDPKWNMAEYITQHHDDPCIRHYAGSLKPLGRQTFTAWAKAPWP